MNSEVQKEELYSVEESRPVVCERLWRLSSEHLGLIDTMAVTVSSCDKKDVLDRNITIHIVTALFKCAQNAKMLFLIKID